jgi:hypothetical protein
MLVVVKNYSICIYITVLTVMVVCVKFRVHYVFC